MFCSEGNAYIRNVCRLCDSALSINASKNADFANSNLHSCIKSKVWDFFFVDDLKNRALG